MTELPIQSALPELLRRLRDGSAAVLQAPPGAGKTTRVPLALLEEPWLRGQRIVMLEPRRLAARGAAAHMASLLGERVGDSVGYRVRMDTRVGPRTRVEVVTEGVLTRMLQSDPTLDGVGAVIFDEFHERSLQADLGLALCLQTRSLLREELRLLVMSATLDGEGVARLLGDAPVVTSHGRSYPVEVRYLDRRREGFVEPLVAQTIERALGESEGDVLVFLPGAGEIRRVEERLRERGLGAGVRVLPLYGALSQEAQDAAIRASRPGERKVVLATSIAETSLTIEGVRVVVDSGLSRVPRFSPRTGMTRLETVTASAASAEQRRGRAGRLAPGVCYRLWTEADQGALVPHAQPEVLEADLAPLALELAAWGISDPADLRWLDAPPAAAFAQGRELLRELGALERDGAITAHGRAMAELAVHPRLAHMLLRAREMGAGALGCALAALLEERDVLRSGAGVPDADLRLRLEALRQGGRGADPGALARVREQARHWRRLLGVADAPLDPEGAGALVALAYPDRVALARPGAGGRFLLRNGRGAALTHPQALSPTPWLAVAELDGRGAESRILLAAPVQRDELLELFGDQVEQQRSVAWDADAGAVRAWTRATLGALTVREAPLAEIDPEELADAVVQGIRAGGGQLLPWTGEALRTRQRLAFAHALDPAWPDVSDEALLATLDRWLRPHLYGIRRADELQRLDLGAILLGTLPWDRRAALDEIAPSHLVVPSGSRIAIDYSDPAAPVLAVRLQEVFGLEETPRVGRGRVPLLIHLLSPARRPVQVTRDLASFWRGAYFEVKKDLKWRYPKHHWPDDPLQATPTSRARRKGEEGGG